MPAQWNKNIASLVFVDQGGAAAPPHHGGSARMRLLSASRQFLLEPGGATGLIAARGSLPMIYMDVSDSCRSPMNTGIQRVVRGMHRGLRETGLPLTPMLWESKFAGYCALSRRERGFLEAPFAGAAGRKALAQPSRVANPIPVLSKFFRQLIHRRNRLNLAAQLKSSDVIFLPQVFRDGRGASVTELGAKTGARCVAMFYDAIPWRRPDVTPPGNVAGVVEYMMALAQFDAVIANSREATEDLRACWKMHKATKMPPTPMLAWPPDESFDPAPHKTSSAPSPATRPKLLCVGTFEPRKNHLTLLAAAEILWQRHRLDFELELIGRTTRECGTRVVAEIERLRAAGWPVAWRRHIDNDAVLAAYDECAFTVFPSLMEGYGLPIIESLRRGKPCVCGANGALGELASGGGCLMLDQAKPETLAEGMRRLLTDEALYERLCAEASERKFETWTGFTAKLLPILKQG